LGKAHRLRPSPTARAAGLPIADEPLPAIVLRARQDALSRRALAGLGYAKVRAQFVAHKRQRKQTFTGLGPGHVAPHMDLVRDWLNAERKRIRAQTRGPFLMTMLATIVAGFVFLAVARILD
jgi:hypothetical protein